MPMNKGKTLARLVLAAGAAFLAAVVSIVERKAVASRGQPLLVEVTEDDTDPALWGVNWPRQYDNYRHTGGSHTDSLRRARRE